MPMHTRWCKTHCKEARTTTVEACPLCLLESVESHKPEIIRWVLVFHDLRDGAWKMCLPQQGRNTHRTQREAEAQLYCLFEANSPKLLEELWGTSAKANWGIAPLPCYEGHHDPKRIYPHPENVITLEELLREA